MSETIATYDLHLHSLWSYDACTPLEYYFQRAQELKLRAFAVTDHHNFDAFEEILQVAKNFPGVGFIPGAEMTIKCLVDGGLNVFDVVCLGLPRTPPPALQKVFDTYHQWQREWGDNLCRLLQERGHDYTREDRKRLLLTYRPERVFDVQGVTHVRNEIQRDYLLGKGYVASAEELGQLGWEASGGAAGYEGLTFMEGNDVIRAVHDAGGICLIAHPAGYFHGLDERRIDAVMEALELDGIECAHPSVPEENTAFYRDYCVRHGLLSSGGTDVHQDPPHEYLKLSVGRSMAHHRGEDRWLDELLERVRVWRA